jgi:hypothetical protein
VRIPSKLSLAATVHHIETSRLLQGNAFAPVHDMRPKCAYAITEPCTSSNNPSNERLISTGFVDTKILTDGERFSMNGSPTL